MILRIFCSVYILNAVSMRAPHHCDVHNKHALRIAIGGNFYDAHAQQARQGSDLISLPLNAKTAKFIKYFANKLKSHQRYEL